MRFFEIVFKFFAGHKSVDNPFPAHCSRHRLHGDRFQRSGEYARRRFYDCLQRRHGIRPSYCTSALKVDDWRDGDVHVQDAHSPLNGRPLPDARQSFTVHETAVNQTHMIAHVERMMDTCDADDFALNVEYCNQGDYGIDGHCTRAVGGQR